MNPVPDRNGGVAERIRLAFEELSGLRGLPYEVKERSDGDVVVIRVANPTSRLFQLLRQASENVEQDQLFPTRATLKQDSPDDPLHRPEAQLYLRVLTESLSVTKSSFRKDFFERYTTSVLGAEGQLSARANHLVFGRRGSGKSSLLLYTLHQRLENDEPNVWIELQVYHGRADNGVVVDILWEVLVQTVELLGETAEVRGMMDRLAEMRNSVARREDVVAHHIKLLLPDFRRILSFFGHQGKSLFIFLDDLHVLDPELQPRLLGILHALSRGNNIFLKISSIESFTKGWDPGSREGLEVTHDVQIVRLDYNLTKPEKAREHIETILNAHAEYSGLPSARYLCIDREVITRLVWVAAGVPRDALNVFAQAMTTAIVDDRPRMAVTNINSAASEAINDKLRDVQLDSSGRYDRCMEILEHIKTLCVLEKKINAFLVEIANDDPIYENVLRLVDLRLLHVIHPGITIREAGRKYMALILDYGFYVGFRAATSVDLFELPKGKGQYTALRGLPVFRD